MGRTSLVTTLLTLGALLSSVDAQAADSGLRRKRSQYKSRLDNNRSSHKQKKQRHLTEELKDNKEAKTKGDVGGDLAHKFFLPTNHEALDDVDMRALILEMNFDGSMSFHTRV